MDINIIEARLLTKEEAERLPERLRAYDNWWSTATSHANASWYACYVYGSTGYFTYSLVDNVSAVRPALIFESKDFEIGDTFFFGDKVFEVIKEDLAFCTTDIGICAFRKDWQAEDVNQYEQSDIKKFIDKWFAKNLKTNNIKTERKQDMDINIIEARLLTKEEADALPKRLKVYYDWWWTKSTYAYNSFHAWCMFGADGYLCNCNVDVDNAIRPAVIFESEDLKVGDTFSFGNKEFEVIKDGLAFCTTDIGECAFRTDWKAEDANQYEASNIKKFIDKWFKENLKTNNIKTERKYDMKNYIVINGKKAELTKEQLEKLGIEVKKDNPFERLPNEYYFYIDDKSHVSRDREISHHVDTTRYNAANYCHDKDLMQQRAYHETLDRLLWRFACENGELDNPWDGKHRHYCIYAEDGALKVEFNWTMKRLHPTFPSEEIAQRAIDEIVKSFMKEHPDFVW